MDGRGAPPAIAFMTDVQERIAGPLVSKRRDGASDRRSGPMKLRTRRSSMPLTETACEVLDSVDGHRRPGARMIAEPDARPGTGPGGVLAASGRVRAGHFAVRDPDTVELTPRRFDAIRHDDCRTGPSGP